MSVGSLSGSQCCPNPSPSLVCSLPGQGRSPGSLAAPLPLPGGQEHRGRSAEGPHPSLPSSHPPSLGADNQCHRPLRAQEPRRA